MKMNSRNSCAADPVQQESNKSDLDYSTLTRRDDTDGIVIIVINVLSQLNKTEDVTRERGMDLTENF